MIKRSWMLGLALVLSAVLVTSAQDAAPQAPATPAETAAPAASAPQSTPTFQMTPLYSDAAPVASDKLFGIIARSDHGFDNFISAMTNPIYFEDPRTVTELRPIFVNHALPTALGGNNAQVIAVQARAALTDRLSIIATKDGFIWPENSIGGLSDGFLDVNAGLKYNLYKNYATQTLLSTGFTYGVPLGSHQALQGKGNGEINMFLSGGTQIGDWWHVLSTFGARIPANNADYTESTYWSNHLDRQLGNSGFYLFTEANWYHWLNSGNQLPVNFEGLDLFNLGSTNVLGHDIVTGAYGVKYKPNGHVELGIAYEIPYTDRRDILQNRLTVDMILRY